MRHEHDDLRHSTIPHRRPGFCELALPERLWNQTNKSVHQLAVVAPEILTLRYLVRSYVTRPTTMSAMTEIPANTPRPMGRTESWVPGSWNLAAALDDAESAADVAVEVLSSPATETAVVDEPVEAAAADAALPVETALAATEETAPAETAPAVLEAAAAEDALPVAAAVPVDPEERAVPATVLVP